MEPRTVSASVVKHKLVVCGPRLPSTNGNRLRCQRGVRVLSNARTTRSGLGCAYCSQKCPSYRAIIHLDLNQPFAIVTAIRSENLPNGRECQIEMRLAIRRCMRKSDCCDPGPIRCTRTLLCGLKHVRVTFRTSPAVAAAAPPVICTPPTNNDPAHVTFPVVLSCCA